MNEKQKDEQGQIEEALLQWRKGTLHHHLLQAVRQDTQAEKGTDLEIELK